MIEPVKHKSDIEQEEVFDFENFIVDPKVINSDMGDFLSGKIPKGFTTGIHALDSHFVFKKNEFYILTGKKGAGKTTINIAIQLMGSIVNDLVWVVAFQENSEWSMKLNYMNYFFGDYSNNVKRNDLKHYNLVSDWIDQHFIFIEVDSIKMALNVTKHIIIEKGIDVHAVLLDPINTFRNGWQDTGNGYADGLLAAMEVLKFTKKFCSVHISQHPNMTAQRQEGAVTSYQGEGGWFLNKASFTYVIHREKGTNENHLIVENVRNKHTGGGETDTDNPVILEWSPNCINIVYLNGLNREQNVIQKLISKYNPLKVEQENLPLIAPEDAFEESPIAF